jgi:hypothetical protein
VLSNGDWLEETISFVDVSTRTLRPMCRSIRTLFNFAPPATDDEIHAAALQFVRKLSGYTRPAKANEAAFERAVAEVAAAAKRLLESMETTSPPRDRDVEAEKAKARGRARFARAAAG